jgi:hypothetical protein
MFALLRNFFLDSWLILSLVALWRAEIKTGTIAAENVM